MKICLHLLRRAAITRSTGTVHTSNKARLTCVAMQIRIRIQIVTKNIIICSLAQLPTFPKSFMQIRSEVFAQTC